MYKLVKKIDSIMECNTEGKITLKSGDGSRIQFPKEELLLFSDYFKGLFNSGMKESEQEEIELPALTGVGLESLASHCQQKLILTMDIIEDVLNTASYLQVESLSNVCETFLKENIDLSSRNQIMLIGEEFGLQGVLDAGFQYLLRNVQEFMGTEEFLGWPLSEVITFLKHDGIDCDTEMTVYRAACEWFRNNDGSKTAGFESLMECVRFGLMREEELESCSATWTKHPYHAFASHYFTNMIKSYREGTLKSQIRANIACVVAVGGFTSTEHSTGRFQVLPVDSLCGLIKDSPSVVQETAYNEETGHPRNRKRRPRSASRGREQQEELIFKPIKKVKLPLPLCEHAMCVLDNFLYVAGGQASYTQDGRYTRNNLYRFDPRHCSWKECTPMLVPRSLFYLGELDGALYAVAGWHSPGRANRCTERYDVEKDCWAKKASLDVGLHEHAGIGIAEITGCSLNGLLYVSGGYKGPRRGHLDTVSAYDPSTDQWRTLAPLVKARSYHTMVAYKGHLIVAGGVNYIGSDVFEDIKEVEMYTPETNQWCVICHLPVYATCTDFILHQGVLHLFGGHSFQHGTDHRNVISLDLNNYRHKETAMDSSSILCFATGTLKFPKFVFRSGVGTSL